MDVKRYEVRILKEKARLFHVLFVLVVVIFIFAGRPRWSVYSVKELVIFLFAIAILVVLVSAMVATLFLLWRAFKLGLLGLEAVSKNGFVASVRARRAIARPVIPDVLP